MKPWNTVSAAFADQQRHSRKIETIDLILIFRLQIPSDLYSFAKFDSSNIQQTKFLSSATYDPATC